MYFLTNKIEGNFDAVVQRKMYRLGGETDSAIR